MAPATTFCWGSVTTPWSVPAPEGDEGLPARSSPRIPHRDFTAGGQWQKGGAALEVQQSSPPHCDEGLQWLTSQVHFPQAFSTSVLVLAVSLFVFRGKVADFLAGGLKFLSPFLPLLVALSLLAGWLDGRVRFKKIGRSLILKRKLALAFLFLLFSIALALLVWLKGGADSGMLALIILFALAAFVCSFLLGLLGTRIYNSEWPGD